MPVHAAFASHADLLAVLWEQGALEIFDLKTRLGPGRGKVVDPVPIWSGAVTEGGSKSYRQVAFDQCGSGNNLRLVVLGADTLSDATDSVSVIDIQGTEKTVMEVPLSARNGRLVPTEGILWEDPEGHVYAGPLQ